MKTIRLEKEINSRMCFRDVSHLYVTITRAVVETRMLKRDRENENLETARTWKYLGPL